MSKKVLITGASSGFGYLTAKTLIEKGNTVIASMRNIAGKNKAISHELKALGASIVEIDVTDEKSVNSGVSLAIEMGEGLDVVINNAGVGVIGLQESFTPDDFKKLFEVNVFGPQRVNRAALPYLRKQGSGVLIQVSSILGRMTFPFYGPYNASKWAVEALAENYRAELSGFGVESCIVEPGGYPTAFMDSLLRGSDSSRSGEYGELANAPEHLFKGFTEALAANPEQNPQNVADAISDLISTKDGERPFRTVVDKMGMGDPIKEYNDHLEKIMSAIYENFGMGDMLKIK